MQLTLATEMWGLIYFMAESKTTAVAVKSNDIGTQVIQRVDDLCKVGFALPANYNHINAIKASMLVLSELKDRNGRPFNEVCSPQSIQKALFVMATRGLDVSKNQAYYIVRGNQLCLHESYYGKVARVKRVYPDFDPTPRVIYQGDVFEYTTDINTGRMQLVKHEQKLENLDNDFVGAYMYLPCPDGGQKLYIMSKKAIMSAWMKSSNKSLTVHQEFREKMIGKTIINSGCTMIINATPELFEAYVPTNQGEPDTDNDAIAEEPIAVEAHEVVEVDPETVPVAKVEANPAPAPQPTMNPEEDF